MELLLGSHVREHGSRVGHLAGFELEPASRKIRRLIISPDGDLGPQATMRPLTAVARVHDDGEIELQDTAAIPPMPAVRDVVLLSRATRLRKHGQAYGRFVGLDVNPPDLGIVSIFGRLHWWARRFTVAGASIDVSTPGEIGVGTAGGNRAA